MDADAAPRRVRADAERSTARILEAAEAVLAEDETASLERIADAAGLARATVHRRFSSRTALLDALAAQLAQRYVQGLAEARVDTAPPVAAMLRMTETAFALKIAHRFAVQLTASMTPEVQDGLDRLFVRLREAGAITASEPTWGRRVYLALLHEVNDLPADSPMLDGDGGDGGDGGDEVAARAGLLVRTVLRALGGDGA